MSNRNSYGCRLLLGGSFLYLVFALKLSRFVTLLNITKATFFVNSKVCCGKNAEILHGSWFNDGTREKRQRYDGIAFRLVPVEKCYITGRHTLRQKIGPKCQHFLSKSFFPNMFFWQSPVSQSIPVKAAGQMQVKSAT